jgi:ribonuclease R
MPLVEEVYQGYVDMTRSGAAYIICEKLDKDVFVPAKRTRLAMDGDHVQVSIFKRYGDRLEGNIIKILKRSTEQFIGHFQNSKNFGFVVPDNRMIPFDIFVYPKDQMGAEDGDQVKVKVLDWPAGRNQSPIGKITKILDKTDQHEIMMQSILANQGFDVDFPQIVEEAAKKLPHRFSEADLKKRRDFRKISTFTIDPLTAKDFDDAISYRKLDNGHVEVGIHIADVSHYVKPHSDLDKEAYLRATSVYLVDRVAPMLPEILSNELCSLRPDEESLTFSAVFDFDPALKLVKKWFGKTIIYSQKRFTYEEAQEVLDNKSGVFKEELLGLQKIARHLRVQKFSAGAISFDAPEILFELDEKNHPIAVVEKKRLEAHLLIEDLMLLANREVATFIGKREELEIPFVYRIHDAPDPQRIAEFSMFLHELNFPFHYQTPTQIRNSFNSLTLEAKKDEVLAMVEPLAIRTMAKAIYSTQNIGHFGLAFDYYTHFTSPIRRYSDILVHRILEKNLEKVYRVNKEKLESNCLHISNQERKAQEAERDSIKFKQVEFIADHIGETFDGIVSGMIDRGIFVSLSKSRVEGMVGFETLNEPYIVSENRMKAVGKQSQHTIKIGDQVKVTILEANLEDLQVEMALSLGHL